jgi:hypothetical protein
MLRGGDRERTYNDANALLVEPDADITNCKPAQQAARSPRCGISSACRFDENCTQRTRGWNIPTERRVTADGRSPHSPAGDDGFRRDRRHPARPPPWHALSVKGDPLLRKYPRVTLVRLLHYV